MIFFNFVHSPVCKYISLFSKTQGLVFLKKKKKKEYHLVIAPYNAIRNLYIYIFITVIIMGCGGLHPQHMAVPSPGIESKQQLGLQEYFFFFKLKWKVITAFFGTLPSIKRLYFWRLLNSYTSI